MKRLTLVVLAACGSSKPAPWTPPPDEDVPVSIDAGPDVVLPLELATERACACTDDVCRAAARESLADLEVVRYPQPRRYLHLLVQLAGCLSPIIEEDIDREYPALTDFTTRACECETDACATEVVKEFVAWTGDGGVLRSVVVAAEIRSDVSTDFYDCLSSAGFDG